MPTPRSPGVIKCELRYLSRGEKIENVFYVHTILTIDESVLDTLATAILTNATGPITNHLPNTASVQELVLTDITTTSSMRKVYTTGLPTTGSQSAGIANALSFAIHKSSTGRGRSNSGRVYIPAIPDTKLNGNDINATWANEWVAVWNDLKDDINALGSGDYLYGLLSTMRDGVFQDPAIFVAVSNHSYTDLHLDTQRRRGAGRGQ